MALQALKRLFPERSPLRLGWHKGKAFLAALRYGFPARRLTVIGITGTDGKTTTVGMIAHILHTTGHRVGAASTAFMQINGERMENATHLTSVDPFSLQKFLRTLVRQTCKFAVIEMSSHGLVQGRVDYTFPSVAGITNIALEHLDYHKTMEQYQKDKSILFQKLRGKGTKVLNVHDETFPSYSRIPSHHTITYTNNGDADLSVDNTHADDQSTSATLNVRSGDTYPLTLSVPGLFNIDNALCAIACCKAVGISVQESIAALKDFRGIPGRMERIDEGQPFSVFIDFAVSPQAYEKTLQTLRGIVGADHKVLVLCSSCGNRMKEKRPEIGRVCSKLADIVVATEDETYGEDPHNVLEEVWAGIDQSACEAHKIFDRREAIAFILSRAQTGDAVVLCGMGPFSTMTKLEGRIPWDEREIAREILKNR